MATSVAYNLVLVVPCSHCPATGWATRIGARWLSVWHRSAGTATRTATLRIRGDFDSLAGRAPGRECRTAEINQPRRHLMCRLRRPSIATQHRTYAFDPKREFWYYKYKHMSSIPCFSNSALWILNPILDLRLKCNGIPDFIIAFPAGVKFPSCSPFQFKLNGKHSSESRMWSLLSTPKFTIPSICICGIPSGNVTVLVV